MKKSTLNPNVKLSTVKGTVASVINDNLNNINTWYNDPTVDNYMFKAMIISLINGAKATPAQKRILGVVNSINNKDRMVQYIYDVMMKGDNLGVINI